MNIKTIKRKLMEKHRDFIASIDNEEIAKVANRSMYITGGAIVSLLNNEEPNDYDYYFTNKEDLITVSQYFINKMNQKLNNKIELREELEEEEGRVKAFIESSGVAKIKYKKGYQPFIVTSNAITLSDDVQIVIRFYGEPDQVHEYYDFVHCTNYFIPHKNELVLPQGALQSILTKELTYVGSKYPLASIVRTRKFIQRGFNINAGQYLKMIMQLNKLSLDDPIVLEEQLIGMDLTYFSMIIELMHEAKDKGEKFDSDFMNKIIDKVFNEENVEENEQENDDEGE